MAIGLDGHSKVKQGGGGLSGPFTVSHTCGGVQRLLVVVFSGMRGALGSWSVSGLTYNGTSLTSGAANESSGSSRNIRTEVWYLVNPPGGSSYSVSVSVSASLQSYSLAAISLTEVDQSSPVGNTGTDAGNKSSYSVGLSTSVADAWLIGGAGIRNGNRTWTPQGSTTEIYEQASGSDTTNDVVGCGDYLVCTSAGSYSLASNADSSNLGVMAGIVVQPASSAPAAWFGAEFVAVGGVWTF